MNTHLTRMKVTTLLVVTVIFGLTGVELAQAAGFRPLPGAVEMSENIKSEIDRAWKQRSSSHQIRSLHQNDQGQPHYANRLLLEKSPYLRQHAHNPVNWHSWGEDAFTEASEHDRPVLLSIGYSSCHWCHVMEEQSYDNEIIAKILNENFVSIKVDREANPDIDAIYLLAVQVMGGNGGWPLHVFLTPERKPFLGMTYVPPGDFVQVLHEVHAVWNQKRDVVENLAEQVTRNIEIFNLNQASSVKVGKEQVDRFIADMVEWEQSQDEFSTPTAKFPSESELFLLLDSAVRYRSLEALELADNRLTDMALGGIRDHVGGGFHRYTVDSEWLIPHFEKMLYNQAHIARSYLYAYELTGKALYSRIAQQTLDYVLRDMTNEHGVFYSATDADSEGEEGVFFLWTVEEIKEAAGADAEFVIAHYGATEEGNFEGDNILFLPATPQERALAAGLSLEEYLDRLAKTIERMRIFRDQREKPFLDTKIITAWNAMMITTLSEASRIIGDERYLEAAIRAAQHIWNNSRSEGGLLYRIQVDGHLTQIGKLRDYAYLLQALVSLYDETGDRSWLDRSELLAEQMVNLFWDNERGGFYSTSVTDAQGLIVRPKDRQDSAIPSGNSVAAKSLSRLYYRTGKEVYARRAEQVFQAFGNNISAFPSSFTYALTAVEEHQNGSIGSMEYAASGHARVSISVIERSDNHAKAIVDLKLDEGWHVQSDQPASENLIATEIAISTDGWILENASYPPAEMLTASFQAEPLSVFSGDVRVHLNLAQAKNNGVEFGPVVRVRLQACDDTLCLLPETVSLEIPSIQSGVERHETAVN